MHWNIRSLPANFDHINSFLFDLNHVFSLIGISETKLKLDKEQTSNIGMEGYYFISQPTITNAGGLGFYSNKNITSSKRDQFSTSKQDYEGLWVDVENKHQRNIVCGIIYRHPKGNIETFLAYLYDVIESVHNENKLCILMGDFNINLLNFESHPTTEQFLNSPGTYFFHPHILKPTRITNHFAT